jgi:hypothetical protein
VELDEVAAALNTASRFCGVRDVAELTQSALEAQRGWHEADVIILFGGSLLSGADAFAAAVKGGVARTTMIVGGEGHTTSSLRTEAARTLGVPVAPTSTEAEIFQTYLHERHSLDVDLLETESTNCGNNITNALGVLERAEVPAERFILMQDVTMQRRMSAGLRRHRPGADVVGFATYTATASADGGHLHYSDAPDDIWSVARLGSMLMGEVGRLRDDEHGYGPRGRGWIAHVDIPEPVERAHQTLAASGLFESRPADPRWASR